MNSESEQNSPPNGEMPAGTQPRENVQQVKVWDSAEILGGQREVVILHGDQAYRLLCTRNGKLILQK